MARSRTTTAADAPASVGGCCSPLAGQEMPVGDAERLATVLKALADPVRLRLLSLVRASEAGEACVCDLTDALGLSQPTVSHHLKTLVTAGVLTREKRGVWAWYRLVPETLDTVGGLLTTGPR
jgi:ArsR family transcriptional regulator, arsenate/arsenite/antimonite-responsive transcriptional repressor